MATKTISITEEAYTILASLRNRERESFSEIITDNLGGKNKLKELHGILSKEAGESLEKNIIEMRKAHGRMQKKRTQKILKELE
ncbi:antitoxin VapB family protein [Candidatus Pacearchaeota archaeon]|nr:antitoxin VapB family protein [Candidatus Pacearchaeota archaeon]